MPELDTPRTVAMPTLMPLPDVDAPSPCKQLSMLSKTAGEKLLVGDMALWLETNRDVL
jgi:hypothetical protein